MTFETDENGTEWFGYAFSCEETDHATVIGTFTGNMQYLEWFFRQIAGNSKQRTLADQLHFLFDLLPKEAERAITDDRPSLVREIVRTRNRYAHGKFEEVTPDIARVHTLSLKVAALLSFAEQVHDGQLEAALSMARGGSPYLRGKLGETDAA